MSQISSAPKLVGMTIEDMRAEFEAFVRRGVCSDSEALDFLRRDGDGTYTMNVTRGAWAAYQGAAFAMAKRHEQVVIAAKVASRTMGEAERLISSLNLHDEWHETGKLHGAFHDLIYKRTRLEEALAGIA